VTSKRRIPCGFYEIKIIKLNDKIKTNSEEIVGATEEIEKILKKH
jgi:hypothetical protein